MSELRIISDNAADRATVTVPGTAVGLGVSNLKTNIKGQVCRVPGSTATITASWAADEAVAAVVLPACSLSADATVRVQVFDAADVLVIDTGERWAVPGTTLDNWDFTQPLNVNAFAEGAAICQIWFEHVAARRVVVTLSDPGAPFIDLARLVIGPYFAPARGPRFGAAVGTLDLSKTSRAASGDLRTDWAPRATTLSFDLDHIAAQDRARVRQLLAAGTGKWLFVSLRADDQDPVREQDFCVYGKRVSSETLAWVNAIHHATTIQMEGW